MMTKKKKQPTKVCGRTRKEANANDDTGERFLRGWAAWVQVGKELPSFALKKNRSTVCVSQIHLSSLCLSPVQRKKTKAPVLSLALLLRKKDLLRLL
jgi:hypothetical protein